MCSTSTCSLKLPSRNERTYNKSSNCRSVTHFQYRNDVLSFNFCVTQSYGNKQVSLTDAASRSLIKSAHRVIYNVYLCNVYLALFKLFTSTTVESPIMEIFFPVRNCTFSLSVNCLWITNKDCSIWTCPIIDNKFLGHGTGVIWKERIQDNHWHRQKFDQIKNGSPFHIQVHQMSLHNKSANVIF